jgi:hypothetical protein
MSLPKLIGQSFILTWQLVNPVSKDLHNQTGTMQLLHFVLTVIVLFCDYCSVLLTTRALTYLM